MSTAAYALPDRELVLERYRPLRPLGRGGSGSVWLSRDERTGLDVALKIVPREGKRAARAEREMEAASRLRHPRCVRAYEYGEDDGHVYIAYEFVQGRTLREVLRHDGLGDADAVEAAAQMLEALAHAHARGVVHRDVKPSNVLLEDGPISTKLLDFGLAQFDEADTLTAVGDVPGTLAYIAPERLKGAEASAASDVWAVGVFLWEALTGGHPFWGVPLPEVAGAITAGAPPLATRRPDLPRRLLAAVDGALSLEPAARPPAGRLATELREAFVVARTAETAPRRRERTGPKAKPPRPTPVVDTSTRAERLGSAALAGAATVVGAVLLPFWPPGLVVALAVAAALLTLRAPRAGLAIALAAPVFPLGNLARGAAIVYGVFALVWLAAQWREPRTGLLFVAGPLLAPFGLIALLPLAVQPARAPWRRALHALAAVPAAALAAGLAGRSLPLGDAAAPDLGLAGTDRASDVVSALTTLVAEQPQLLSTGLVFAATALALPLVRARGHAAVGGLCLGQAAFLLFCAPLAPVLVTVGGTVVLFGALVARPVLALVVAKRDGYHREG